MREKAQTRWVGELADCNFREKKKQVSLRGCYESKDVKEVLGGRREGGFMQSIAT